jgi:FKBP-type peptidyl-prolyl cis-trans isomerase FklB
MTSILKFNRSLALAGSLAFSSIAAAQLSTTEQRASYAIGTDLANNLISQGIELNVDSFLLGLEDQLKSNPLKLSEAEMTDAIREFMTLLEAKQNAQLQSQSEENLIKGQAFLAENKKKPDIITLESGLQYRVIEEGEGAMPNENDRIIAHYRGRLIDGTEFDSSFNRGTPIQFELNGVIPGWQEAIKRMRPGAKWEVFIPAELAYGLQGAGNAIGPNETLIFEIHFITTAVE